MSKPANNFNVKKSKGRSGKFMPRGKDPQNFKRNAKGKDGDYSGVVENIKHKFNDVSWYTKNSQMLVDAASYSYNAALGTPLPWQLMVTGSGLDYTPVVNSSAGNLAVPGLCVLKVLPTIGISTDAASPANVAAQNIYSFVRYMNSGAKNYDQADLMIYLLAMDSIYACWNWLKRVYGYLRTYSQFNKYMPLAYLQADTNATNVSGVTLYQNLADFRLYLNQAAAKISAFCVPAVMPLFIRHSWMFSNIYKDSDSLKAQQYIFSPEAFYQYNETGSEFGGQLVPKPISTNLTSFSGMCKYLDALIDAIAYSEDIGVMSGDILKAYGESKLFKLTAVDADYEVLPVYNEEVLNQIHNSTIVPIKQPSANAYDASYTITQDPNTGYLKWDPKLNALAYSRAEVMINMPWDNVTPANTMVGTRLTAMVTGSGSNYMIDSCGSEIVTRRIILVLRANGSYQSMNFDTDYWAIDAVSDSATIWSSVRPMLLLSQFDWHPLVPIIVMGGTLASPKNSVAGILGDVNNYTMMDEDDLQKLHYTAIMSEFNIPQLGSF